MRIFANNFAPLEQIIIFLTEKISEEIFEKYAVDAYQCVLNPKICGVQGRGGPSLPPK